MNVLLRESLDGAKTAAQTIADNVDGHTGQRPLVRLTRVGSRRA